MARLHSRQSSLLLEDGARLAQSASASTLCLEMALSWAEGGSEEARFAELDRVKNFHRHHVPRLHSNKSKEKKEKSKKKKKKTNRKFHRHHMVTFSRSLFAVSRLVGSWVFGEFFFRKSHSECPFRTYRLNKDGIFFSDGSFCCCRQDQAATCCACFKAGDILSVRAETQRSNSKEGWAVPAVDVDSKCLHSMEKAQQRHSISW